MFVSLATPAVWFQCWRTDMPRGHKTFLGGTRLCNIIAHVSLYLHNEEFKHLLSLSIIHTHVIKQKFKVL